MFVPYPAADRVEHDPLKAMIVPNRPVAIAGSRKCGHDCAGQMQVLLDESEVGRLRQIGTALHLVSRWWAGPGLSTAADGVFFVEPDPLRAACHRAQKPNTNLGPHMKNGFVTVKSNCHPSRHSTVTKLPDARLARIKADVSCFESGPPAARGA